MPSTGRGLSCPTHGIPDCSPLLNGCSWPNRRPCPYCGKTDHSGREHAHFVMSLLGGEEADDA